MLRPDPQANRPESGLAPAWLVAAAAWLALLVFLIYGFDLGQGFVKDDYAWIATSQIHQLGDLRRTFVETPMGFYRPLVALSFGLNHLLFALEPRPYALTNLAMAIAIAIALAGLVRRLGLSWGAGLFAAGVWILNFHGINMSILWISGRTSLLATLAAVLAALAFQGSRRYAAGGLVLISLLAKEEPLLLPLVLALWTAIDLRQGAAASATAAAPIVPALNSIAMRAVAATWPSLVAVAIYLLLRANTNAFTPATAPAFYQLDPAAIASNAVQYLDRSLTFTTALLLLGAASSVFGQLTLTPLERRTLVKGAVWLVGGFALTIMLPVRSSLYVCLPSIGSALIAAAIGSAEWRALRSRRLAVVTMLLLPLVLLPVYRARNTRLKREAQLAAHVLTTLREQAVGNRGRRIILYDSPGQHPSLADAFSNALPQAIDLFLPAEERPDVVINDGLGGVATRGVEALRFRLQDGALVRWEPSGR